MPDHLHYGALILELLKFVLLDNLSFDLLDGHNGVLPASTVDDTVAAFGEFAVVAELIEAYLVVLNEGSSFIRNIIVTARSLLLNERLLELTLEV